MTLCTVRDIDLGALLAELVTCLAVAHARGIGPVIYAAVANVVNEIGARGKDEHIYRSLFQSDDPDLCFDRDRFEELIGLIAADVERAGFPEAAAALRADAILALTPTLADAAGVARSEAQHLH